MHLKYTLGRLGSRGNAQFHPPWSGYSPQFDSQIRRPNFASIHIVPVSSSLGYVVKSNPNIDLHVLEKLVEVPPPVVVHQLLIEKSRDCEIKQPGAGGIRVAQTLNANNETNKFTSHKASSLARLSRLCRASCWQLISPLQ